MSWLKVSGWTLCSLLAWGACSLQPPVETAAAPDAEKPQEKLQEKPQVMGDVILRADPETGRTLVEPADGVWLEDEEGRQYFVREVPRVEGGYRLLDDGARVRLPAGLIFDLEGSDDETFYIRVYRVDPQAGGPLAQRAGPEELARAAAAYEHRLDVGRTLRLEDFGRGLPGRGQWRDSFAIADIDGDGHPDIVHGPPRRGDWPAIFLGDGRGGWRHWEEADFVGGHPLEYGGVAVADFNGNGHLDIAFASHLRGVQVFVHDGEGTFTSWSRGLDWWQPGLDPAQRRGVTSRVLAAADWNGSGRPDLLVLAEGPGGPRDALGDRTYGAVVFLNEGDGSWRRQDPESRVQVFGDDLVVADLDGNGRLDFVTGTNVRGQRMLLNWGQPDGTWAPATLEPLRPQAAVRALAAGDLNGNGRLDLVVAYANAELAVPRSGIDILLAQSDGGWERRTLVAEEGFTRSVRALALGDLDGDGALDLVALTADGRTWIFGGDGRGSFWRESLPELDEPRPGCTGFHVEAVDLRGDGRAEIVAAFAGDDCPGGGFLRAWRAVRAR